MPVNVDPNVNPNPNPNPNPNGNEHPNVGQGPKPNVTGPKVDIAPPDVTGPNQQTDQKKTTAPAPKPKPKAPADPDIESRLSGLEVRDPAGVVSEAEGTPVVPRAVPTPLDPSVQADMAALESNAPMVQPILGSRGQFGKASAAVQRAIAGAQRAAEGTPLRPEFAEALAAQSEIAPPTVEEEAITPVEPVSPAMPVEDTGVSGDEHGGVGPTEETQGAEYQSETRTEPEKPDRLVKMATGSNLSWVINEAVTLYTFMIDGKVSPQRVLARIEDRSLWQRATKQGRIGLRLIHGFATGMTGNVDGAADTLATAIIAARELGGDKVAHDLTATVWKSIGSEAKSLLAAHIREKAGINEATAEEAPTEAPAPEQAQAESFDPSKHSVREVNAEIEKVGGMQAVEIIRAEMAGKNRKGIVEAKTAFAQAARDMANGSMYDRPATAEENAKLDEEIAALGDDGDFDAEDMNEYVTGQMEEGDPDADPDTIGDFIKAGLTINDGDYLTDADRALLAEAGYTLVDGKWAPGVSTEARTSVYNITPDMVRAQTDQRITNTVDAISRAYEETDPTAFDTFDDYYQAVIARSHELREGQLPYLNEMTQEQEQRYFRLTGEILEKARTTFDDGIIAALNEELGTPSIVEEPSTPADRLSALEQQGPNTRALPASPFEQEFNDVFGNLVYDARTSAGLDIEPGSLAANSPHALLDALKPAWLDAKDAHLEELRTEAMAEDAARQQAKLYDAAERMDALTELDALEDFLTEFANTVPEAAEWVERINNMLSLLSDLSTPYAALDIEQMIHELEGAYALAQEISFQAKAQRSIDEAKKVEEAKKAAEADKPTPWGYKRVAQNRLDIQENLSVGIFALEGDHEVEVDGPMVAVDVPGQAGKELRPQKVKKIVHSDEVNQVIAWTLRQFGYTNPAEYENLEVWLFRLFQVYRGASIDYNQKWFGDETKQPEISLMDWTIAMTELASNCAEKGYALAYLHPEAQLGGTYCYPMPVTPGLARFLTANSGPDTSNPNGLSQQDYIEYGIRQHNERVRPRILDQAEPDQRNVLLNFADAIVDRYPELKAPLSDGSPGLDLRTPDQFVTMTQMLSAADELAKAHNDQNDLASAARDKHERAMRATEHMDKRLGRNGRGKKHGKIYSGVQRFFSGVNEIAILNQLVAKAGGWLIVTNSAEKVTGIQDVHDVLWVLQRKAKKRAAADPTGKLVDPTVPKEFEDDISQRVNIDLILDFMKIAGSAGGFDMLVDEALNNPNFGKPGADAFAEAMKNAKNKSFPEQVSTYLKHKVRGSGHMATAISVGDMMGNARMAKMFLRALCLFYAEASLNGRPTLTPEQLMHSFRQDPQGFWREVVTSQEGQRALTLAASSSISSFNMYTAALESLVDTPIKKFLLGFGITFFAKYSTNIFLRHFPGSTFGSYWLKKGLNSAVVNSAQNKGRVDAERRAVEAGLTGDALAEAIARGESEGRAAGEGWASDTDMLVIGGGEADVKRGAYQAILVDAMHLRTDAAIFALLLGATALMGVEPPDDDEMNPGKKYRYDEYFIWGEKVKASWFWGDLLKFTMPAVIAIHAGAQANARGEDGLDLAAKIFTWGSWDVIQNNWWIRLTGLYDVLTDFRAEYDQELNRNEGTNIKDSNFIMLTLRSYAIRRGITIAEPGALREAYTESGLYGTDKRDVSSTMIFTPSTEDEKGKTVANEDYGDIRLRRDVKNSVLGGLIANLAMGVYAKNPQVQKTGYLFNERPLITNVEPASQHWVDLLTVRTKGGKEIEYDPKHPEQFADVVKQMRALLDNDAYTPQVLDGSGVVFPLQARYAMDDALYQEAADLWLEYDRRKNSGEWIVKGGFDRAKVIKANQDKQAAKAATQAAVDAIYAKKEKLWSKTIHYGAAKMNRTVTPMRELVVYKDGPLKGQPAPPWSVWTQRDKVDVVLYPTGEHKTNFLPWATVDDAGDRSFDARAQVPWQSEFTDPALVEAGAMEDPAAALAGKATKPYVIPQGLGANEELLAVLTGGGATGLNPTKTGPWNAGEYLFPARGYVKQFEDPVKVDVPKWDIDAIKKKALEENYGDTGGSGNGWAGWSGGGSEYAPKIYSNAPYKLNSDKPSVLYTKSPTYTRFDYLRPSVSTKGSREAYRREDF